MSSGNGPKNSAGAEELKREPEAAENHDCWEETAENARELAAALFAETNTMDPDGNNSVVGRGRPEFEVGPIVE